jgi:hypothetical protein
MSEYEYADLIATYSDNAGSFFAIYLTVVTGYLITSFVAGARLIRSQTLILSFGFIVASFIATWAAYGSGMTQVYYIGQLLGLDAGAPQSARAWTIKLMGILMVGGTIASLLFMWNIRRKIES